MSDLKITQLQETGRAGVEGFTVAEVVEIVQTLSLDPRTVRISSRTSSGAPYIYVDDKDRSTQDSTR